MLYDDLTLIREALTIELTRRQTLQVQHKHSPDPSYIVDALAALDRIQAALTFWAPPPAIEDVAPYPDPEPTDQVLRHQGTPTLPGFEEV